MTHTLRNLLLTFLITATAFSSYAQEKIFDPTRDSAADLKAAQTLATAQHKNILLDVGGDWCSWCHLLDHTFHENQDLKAELEKNYILVHIDFSLNHENKEFLSHYPSIEGFPCLFVLSSDGTLLHQQNTAVLENDHKISGGYNQAAILEFLQKWANHK